MKKFRLDGLSRSYLEFRTIELLLEEGRSKLIDLFRGTGSKGYAHYFGVMGRMEKERIIFSEKPNKRVRFLTLNLSHPVVKACQGFLKAA